MYGVLALFVIVIVIWMLIQSFSGSKPNAGLPTETQAIASTFQAGTEVPGVINQRGTATSTPAGSSGSTTSAAQTSTAVPGTLSANPTSKSPAVGSPPPGVTPAASGQGTPTVSGPQSNSTPPSGSGGQTGPTQSGGPPANGTPPPNSQTTATQSGPPSNGNPPPTLQATPTEKGPPSDVNPPPTATPVSGGTYDDTNAAWQYSGGWAYITKDSGPYNKTIHSTGTTGSYAEVSFRGTGFTFIYTIGPNQGQIDVFVDGAKVDTIDAQGSTVEWQSTWSSGSLTNAAHTVRFAYAEGGTNIDVDAITILP